ncbi:MAG: MBL-fold metallo-hydrolase superfamily [uncultured Chthoniobacterales bacterium]|uniref:MBL-fold metallo-hydrolase superfamily n=1 Tax=uncultured Chthoniobacterales bacterium TaxID=1836801 RepID=A0A6J4IN33_9BACT|nr:MAG: MBL-fold metallo-hydrolase superfamily [uncultured Chthoniobacterales bacterium]
MVHILDTRQLGRPGIIAATAVETADGIALFDTGPESTFQNIVGELRKIGAAPEDVRHVFLSHIHFDHAGSAWRFAEAGATIYVHSRGARHLIDPAKLVESATRIFGDDMPKLWGRVAPVPEERVRVLQDGEVVRVGATDVRAIETPGHASHHHVYHWDENVFGGDVAGVRIGSGPPIPPFVPPELHVESWLESIDKIRALHPARLYLPHFGVVDRDIPAHLDQLEERVRRWSAWFRDRMRAGEDEPQLIQPFAEYEAADLLAGGATREIVRDYETADPSFMAVTAALRYWRKYHAQDVAL